MTTKQRSLIEKYAVDAEYIHETKAASDAAAAKAETAWQAVSNTDAAGDTVPVAQAASKTANDLYHEYSVMLGKLRQDVEAEYAEVPFNAPRRAGIEAVMKGLGF